MQQTKVSLGLPPILLPLSRRLRGVLPRFRQSLEAKLIAIVLAVGLLALATASLATLQVQRAHLLEMTQESAEQLSAVVQTGLEFAMEEGDLGQAQRLLEAVVGESGIRRVDVIDTAGLVRASSQPEKTGSRYDRAEATCSGCHSALPTAFAARTIPRSILLNGELLHIQVLRNGPECQRCHGSVESTLGLLLVKAPITAVDTHLRNSLAALVIAALLGFGLMTIILIPILRSLVVHPISALTAAAARMGTGDLENQVAVSRDDELGQLGGAFDSMRMRLRETQNGMSRRNEQLALLNHISRAVSEQLDAKQIAEMSLRTIGEHANVSAAAIYLVEPGCGHYMLQASQGMSEENAAAMGCRLRLLDRWQRRGSPAVEPVLLPKSLAPQAGSASDESPSWIVAPLRALDVQVGALLLAIALPNGLSPEGAQLLRTLGEAIGLALGNALRYEHAQYIGASQERDRLAAEMHDSLSQALAFLKVTASVTNELLSVGDIDRARAHLAEVREVAGDAYTDVRETIFGLRQHASTGSGFVPALRMYLDDYRLHYGMDVALCVEQVGEPRWSSSTGLQVSRIIQEALANARKHSGSHRAAVALRREGAAWCITVEDFGKGWDLAQRLQQCPNSFGIQIMRERARAIGGTLTIASRIGEGTQVILAVPDSPEALP